jgi:hypothetical protein
MILMKYSKPKCDCGYELSYVEEVTYDNYYRITAKGKREKRKYHSEYYLNNGIAFLKCNACNNTYEIDYDEKDRIIRGDLMY